MARWFVSAGLAVLIAVSKASLAATATGGFIVELLSKEPDREAFDCGHSELNAYLRTQARQEMDRGSAIV